jgi:hypothetical protein
MSQNCRKVRAGGLRPARLAVEPRSHRRCRSGFALADQRRFYIMRGLVVFQGQAGASIDAPDSEIFAGFSGSDMELQSPGI